MDRLYQVSSVMQNNCQSSPNLRQIRTHQDQSHSKDVSPDNEEEILANIFNTEPNINGGHSNQIPQINFGNLSVNDDKPIHPLHLPSNLVDEPNTEMNNFGHFSGNGHMFGQHQPLNNMHFIPKQDEHCEYENCGTLYQLCDVNHRNLTDFLDMDDPFQTRNSRPSNDSGVSGCSTQALISSNLTNTSNSEEAFLHSSSMNNFHQRPHVNNMNFSGFSGDDNYEQKHEKITSNLRKSTTPEQSHHHTNINCDSFHEFANKPSQNTIPNSSNLDEFNYCNGAVIVQSNESSSKSKNNPNNRNQASSDENKVRSKKTDYNKKWGVKVFKAWCRSTGHKEDFGNLEAEELNEVLKKIWPTVRKANGGRYGRNSLFNLRAMINNHVKGPPYNATFDIVTDERFRPSNTALDNELKYLKTLGKEIEHKNPISVEDIQQLYTSGTLSNDNPKSLLRKVWFEITLHFCHKGSETHEKLTKNTFEIRTDPNTGLSYVARKDSAMHNEDVRMIGTHTKFDPVASFQLYIQKLHPEQDRLFQQPRKKAELDAKVWYGKAPIGEKSLQQMMSSICNEAVLDTRYTNHCVRTTNIQTYLTAMSTKIMTYESIHSSYPKPKHLATNFPQDDNFTLDQSKGFGVPPLSLRHHANVPPQFLCSQKHHVQCEDAVNFNDVAGNWCNNNEKKFQQFNHDVSQIKSSVDIENLQSPCNKMMDSSTQNYLSSLPSYPSAVYTQPWTSLKQSMIKTNHKQHPYLSTNSHSQPRNIRNGNLLPPSEISDQFPAVNSVIPFASKLQPSSNISSNPVNAMNNFSFKFDQSESETTVAGQVECNSITSRIASSLQPVGLRNENFNDMSNVTLQGNVFSHINLPQSDACYIDQQSNEMSHLVLQENGTDQHQIQAHNSPVMLTSGSIPLMTTSQTTMPYCTTW